MLTRNGAAELSVVIAAAGSGAVLAEVLAEVVRQAEEAAAGVEVLLVGDAGPSAAVPDARVVRVEADAGSLVPELWARGIERSRGDLVALTIGECRPEGGWIAGLLRCAEEHPECAGFGGPIDAPVGARWRDWAAYFSRYSAYLPPARAGHVAEIPGDDAAYRRRDLDRDWRDRTTGFWETLFHRRLAASQRGLYRDPRLGVRFLGIPSARRFVMARFRHGRHFGATRPVAGRTERIARALAAPLLVPLLVARIVRRVAERRRGWLGRLFLALPWLTVFLCAWSLGELVGSLAAAPAPLEHRRG